MQKTTRPSINQHLKPVNSVTLSPAEQELAHAIGRALAELWTRQAENRNKFLRSQDSTNQSPEAQLRQDTSSSSGSM